MRSQCPCNRSGDEGSFLHELYLQSARLKQSRNHIIFELDCEAMEYSVERMHT